MTSATSWGQIGRFDVLMLRPRTLYNLDVCTHCDVRTTDSENKLKKPQKLTQRDYLKVALLSDQQITLQGRI